MKENEKVILERLNKVSEMLNEGMIVKDMLITQLFEKNNDCIKKDEENLSLKSQLDEINSQ